MNCGHKQTHLIILNFAKAFDKVPHKRLLHKDGQASDPVLVLSAVSQGSVLGLMLFLIFINDLTSGLLFACSQRTVSCIGTHIRFRTVWPCKNTSLA